MPGGEARDRARRDGATQHVLRRLVGVGVEHGVAAVELDDASQSDSEGGVMVHRHEESSLSNTVIFPITEQQRNGLEDLRLVRFEHAPGDYEWIGTYTAYSGSTIRSELLRTSDFRRFLLEPVQGRAGRNKGMALFPRKIDGRFVMSSGMTSASIWVRGVSVEASRVELYP